MVTAEALRTISAYPIPAAVIDAAAMGAGLAPDAEVTAEVLLSPEYRAAQAQLYRWLAQAPDVAQGGQSYSFTDDQRKVFRHMAQTIEDALNADTEPTAIFGYKGELL